MSSLKLWEEGSQEQSAKFNTPLISTGIGLHSIEYGTTLERIGWLQLKPSKCPLRMRSPIGDGARLTGLLGGLFLPFDGELLFVGLLGRAVFGGTGGVWSLLPNPG